MARNQLSSAEVRRSLALSVVEGGCYAVMVGLGEAYFVADGVRLGGSSLLLGLLVGLPLATGGLAATGVIAGLRRLRRRRPLTAAIVVVQALLLLVLALLEKLGATSAPLLLVFVCLHHACGQTCGALWSSWYGDLVPSGIRGSYFARRSRIQHLLTFLALAAGGLLLQGTESQGQPALADGSGGDGFALLFLLAGLMRLVSATLLLLSPEPSFDQPPARGIREVLVAPEQSGVRRMLLAGGAMSFVVYIGSPYFNPFMLENLRLDYRSFMAAAAAQVAAKVLSLRALGRALDAGGPLSVYRLAILLVALIPLPWLFLDGLAGVLAVQAFSGFAWAAHEIAILGMLLSLSESRIRSRIFAAHSLLNGLGQLLGSLLGAAVIMLSAGSYQAAFSASLAGRLSLALLIPLFIAGLTGRQGPGRGELLLRVVGFRPNGGLIHRPVDPDRDSDHRRS